MHRTFHLFFLFSSPSSNLTFFFLSPSSLNFLSPPFPLLISLSLFLSHPSLALSPSQSHILFLSPSTSCCLPPFLHFPSPSPPLPFAPFSISLPYSPLSLSLHLTLTLYLFLPRFLVVSPTLFFFPLYPSKTPCSANISPYPPM